MNSIPFFERITCTVPDALQATGLGRTKFYELVGAGTVKTTKVGKRTLVVVESLRQMAAAPASDRAREAA